MAVHASEEHKKRNVFEAKLEVHIKISFGELPGTEKEGMKK